ncbi:MAG: glycosyltransferase family 4 protein [Frankiales bacterium]|nr:glycosyltransferase family 4 protein [Frankiales bacterium]
MRIALTADPELPVPPRLYGGIERIIDMLARQLVERGHEVTLFAHRDSATAGRLVPWPGLASNSLAGGVRNAAVLTQAVWRGDFDMVHSFSRVAYLTPILPTPIPKLMTYQRPISARTVRVGQALSGGTLAFVGISHWMMRHVEHIGRWFMVPNGVPLETYEFKPKVADDAPFVFLGRLEEIKGPHLAIEIARRCGRKLVLAGNIPPEHQAWFDAVVAPHIDGSQITFVGPVDDIQKNALLGQACAFLMPILWDEPFGIVMAEAMACGTPVLGLNRGSVAEVVEDGVTGFVTETVGELVERAGQIGALDRGACRARVERLYSADAVTDGYLAVYEQLLAARPRGR